ncbi:glycosyltransferase family 39 protein [bacterium]|nr:glycosyltransferase family 39 protein [bacterium]
MPTEAKVLPRPEIPESNGGRDRADASFKSFAAATLLIVAIGLALRLWNIDFGMPQLYHPDENKKYLIVDSILDGKEQNFRSHPLIHPGFMVTITGEACRAAIAMGMPRTRQNIVLVGRILAAIFSAAAIAAAALLAAALFNRRAGVLAAAIVAFSPVHVAHGRYLKEDAFVDLFVMASLAGAAWWLTSEGGPRRKWGLVVCAAAAGLAAGTKYHAAVITIFLAGYFWMSDRATRKERVWFTAIVCIAFSLGAIMLLLNARHIWNEVGYAVVRGAQSRHTKAPMPIYRRPDLGFFFLFHGINWGLGWPLAALGICGVIRGIRARRTHPVMWLAAMVALLWYFSAELTTLKRAPDCERYVLPCIAILAVLASGFIMSLRWKYWPAIGWVCVGMLAAESVAMTYSMKPDTRELAARWIFAQTNGKPCKLAFPEGSMAYQPDHTLLPGYRYAGMKYKGTHFSLREAKDAEILLIVHFTSDRYDKYRKLDPEMAKSLKKLRKKFPYAKIFEKPGYAQNGFHNPTIEVRFKKPFTEPASI